MENIRIDHHDEEPISTVTISNPDRRNAVSMADTEDLASAFRELDADDDVRCVVLTGEGGAFCAGADLSSVAGAASAEAIDRGFHAAVREIATCSKPVIAQVDGAAVGAGAAIAIACDLVYAGESARIGFAFSAIGLTADSGATYFLPKLVGVQTAYELLATGEIVDGERAGELGICAAIVPDDELEEFVAERAAALANGPTRALSSIGQLLLRANENTLEAHLELEAREQARMFQTSDAVEGITAFTEKRDPDFQGA